MTEKTIIKSKTAEAILQQLKNPFLPNLLHFRIGAKTKDGKKAIPLAYITARDVAKRLDDVVGPEGWNKSTEVFTTSSGLVCVRTTLGVKIDPSSDSNDYWEYKDGLGEPSKVAPSLGAESQSFKRAAANFGIGRYLYYLNLGWREIDQYGNFKEDLTKILPKWALPNSNIPDWEEIAEQEFDPTFDFEDLPEVLITEEENELLRKANEVKKAILERAKES